MLNPSLGMAGRPMHLAAVVLGDRLPRQVLAACMWYVVVFYSSPLGRNKLLHI